METYTITLPGKPLIYSSSPLPAGWEIVGEICRDGEIIPGALVRYAPTGIYAQANAGAIRNLDQTEVAKALADTVPGVDIDGDAELSAAQAAELVGQTVQAIRYWLNRGYITPIPGSRPARYKKSEVLAVSNRKRKAGRPPKE